MPALKLIIGLTDVFDETSFRLNGDEIDPTNIHYNLYKQTPEIEKEIISWTFNTELPGLLGAIDAWENIIRTPHLNMIRIEKHPFNLAPAYFNFHFHMDFISLFPIDKTTFFKKLTDIDYNALQDNNRFGDLVIDYFGMLDGTQQINTLSHAWGQNDLTYLEPGPHVLYASPNFNSTFHLGLANNNNIRFGKTSEQIEWMTKNKKVLEEKGYYIDDVKTNIGSFVVGKLDDDPMSAYEKITKYNYICRTSIIKED